MKIPPADYDVVRQVVKDLIRDVTDVAVLLLCGAAILYVLAHLALALMNA